MNWVLFGVEFAMIAVIVPTVIFLLGSALEVNAPTLQDLIVRTLATAAIFATGVTLWALADIGSRALGLAIPVALLTLCAFVCWGYTFDEAQYAFYFALVVGVAHYALGFVITMLILR